MLHNYIKNMLKKWAYSKKVLFCRLFLNKGQTCAFFQSAGSCPVCNVFSNKRHTTGAISVFNCFKTTGMMEPGPAALSGFRFDNNFNTPLR